MIGKTLGNYEIIAPLGAGGMGEVYRAHDTNLKRDVAIKVLPEALAVDAERLARLRREAQLLASVNHPNIAAIYNLEQSEGARWLVLELVEGTTLEQRLREGPLPVRECLRVAGQVAAALEAAHLKGIVHRDLKAANVMLDDDGRIKVLDFGIAKDLSGEGGAFGADASADTSLATSADNLAAQLTATGMIVGTVPYMSPEQIRGKSVDKRTDIWAFGCLLFELLTGRRPFDRETMADTLSAVLEHEPDWQLLPPDTPAALRALLDRCLQKDPDERMHMMADARHEVGVIEATGARGAVIGEAPGSTAAASWLTPKMQAVAAFSALLVVVVGVGWGLLSSLGGADRGDAITGAGGAPVIDVGVEPASLAVLPFQSISAGAEIAYDADSMAVSILSKLSGINGLRVSAWTSSSAFRESNKDIAQIGRDLGVAMILEGTVTAGPDTLVVQASLVDAASGTIYHTVRSNLPRDDLPSIFDFQDQVAAQVVAVLEIEMTDDEQRRLASRSTQSLEAYNEYLRGLQAYPLRTEDALNEALEHFERAVDLDPDFALAHSGIAFTYLLMQPNMNLGQEAVVAARRSVEEAIRLDPDLVEARGVLGIVMVRDREPGGEAQIERAIELDPNNAILLQYYGQRLFQSEGVTDRAVELTRRARDLDPMQPGPNENLGLLLFGAGRLEEAAAQLELVVDLAPEYAPGHSALGVLLQYSGRADEALNHLRQARQLNLGNIGYAGYLARAYADAGREEQAESTLTGWISAAPDDWAPYRLLGDIYRDTGSLTDAAGRYQQSLDKTWRPEVLTEMALLDLDRGDDVAAEARVAELERYVQDRGFSPGNRFRVRAEVGRLNLEMYRSRYAEGAALARELADVKVVRSYWHLWAEYVNQYPLEPFGYFGVLAGEPEVSHRFFEVNFPDLLAEDPPIHAFNLRAAIDLAAVLRRTGEQDHANLLLEKSEAYINDLPDEQRRHQFRLAPMEIYALQGRADDAFAAMELAFEDGWRSGWWRLEHKPHFDAIRDDPRFQEMIDRLRAATAG